MPLRDKIKSLLSNGTATLVEKAGEALDKVFSNKEELVVAKMELEKAINQHTEIMAENSLRHFEAEIKELESARNREIQIANSEKAPKLNKIITPLLALGILGSCFLFWGFLIFIKIDPDKEMIIAGITGSLTTMSMGVIGYYFGSSVGSRSNQEAIQKMASAKP